MMSMGQLVANIRALRNKVALARYEAMLEPDFEKRAAQAGRLLDEIEAALEKMMD